MPLLVNRLSNHCPRSADGPVYSTSQHPPHDSLVVAAAESHPNTRYASAHQANVEHQLPAHTRLVSRPSPKYAGDDLRSGKGALQYPRLVRDCRVGQRSVKRL